jgi:DNA replication protein DnaC
MEELKDEHQITVREGMSALVKNLGRPAADQSTRVDPAPRLGEEELAEFSAAQKLLRLVSIGLGYGYHEKVFGAYRPTTSSQACALSRMIEAAKNFPTERRGVVLSGPTGIGKSHLLAAGVLRILERIDAKEIPSGSNLPHVTNVLRLLHVVRARGMIAEAAQQKAVLAGLLVLDELGLEAANDFALDELMYVLSERYAWRRPTWIATNLDPEGLAAKYGDALMSRFLDRDVYEVMAIKGPDYRAAG